jgi:subtilase family serine protease
MKRIVFGICIAALVAAASSMLTAQGQGQDNAPIVIPDSSVEHPGERGVAAHTNHLISARPQRGGGGGPSGESPASIASVYNLTGVLGGSGIIAIVDAFDYPTAAHDFDVFSAQFGLPQDGGTNQLFQVVYANGTKPSGNCGWNQEAALDIEWAHAMAPNAKIVLVEAASNSFADLFHAIDVASGIAGVKEVSMSWGGSEFSGETAYDGHFPANGIVYFASSGDTGGKTIYPSVSSLVIAAGGTRINRTKSGAFTSETGWSGSGGGKSAFEARPAYQDAIQSIVGASRGVPDYSFDADPNTGVSVYDSTFCQGASGWLVFGGTSVSAPSLAGIVNSAGSNTSSTQELSDLYQGLGNSAFFRDILSGAAGSFTAAAGWDFVTGIGSTNSLAGK